MKEREEIKGENILREKKRSVQDRSKGGRQGGFYDFYTCGEREKNITSNIIII